MVKTLNDFADFLKEYKIIGLAIAVVIGTASKDLVNAFVEDIVMPIIEIFLPSGNWQNATFSLGGAIFKIGHLLSVLIDFLIIAFLIYLFSRHVLKKEKVDK